ncbi:MAG: ABC-2 family transporter protein [Thermomicrobiales bacterium]
MMHSLTVIRTYLRLGLLNMVQYRTNFFFELFGVTVHLVTALLGLAVIFNQTSSLNGWSSSELVMLVGIQTMLGSLLGLVIEPSFQTFMENVRLGTLDFMLTKPADSQVMVTFQRVEGGAIAGTIAGATILGIGIARHGERIGVGQALLFAAMLMLGILIMYSFLLILSTLAFWFVKLDNVLVIFGTTFDQAGRWPIGIYPGWLKGTLTFIIPIAFVVTVPAQALSGRVNAMTVAGAFVLALAFLLGARWFWRYGLKHYTGASA